jgi:hypothetical protein
MLQEYGALFETALRLGREYGPPVAAAVLLLVAAGVAARIVSGLLPRGGPGEGGRPDG